MVRSSWLKAFCQVLPEAGLLNFPCGWSVHLQVNHIKPGVLQKVLDQANGYQLIRVT